MADFSQLVELSESLVQAHTVFEKSRCMPLRNTFSRCSLCVDACPVGAITLEPRHLTVDKTSCVNCGACTTVCPTQALMHLIPSDDELATSAVQAVEASEGMACFACARVMAKRGPDASKIAAVDCLSRVDESLMLGLAAHGVATIVLADGDCSSCKYKRCGQLAHELADEVNQMLEAMGNTTLVITTTGVPEELQCDFSFEALRNERRSLFSHTKDAMRETARQAAALGVKEATGIDVAKKAVQILETDPARHDKLINALERLGEPQDMSIATRRFASLHIDEQACTACKKCVLVCPSQALVKSVLPRDNADGDYYEFVASKCLRCKLCLHVCRDNAITLEDVTMRELFDFEPRLIPVPAAPTYANSKDFFSLSSLIDT